MAKRKVSERSLENLKLGGLSRKSKEVKERHNILVLPETFQWLKGTGNASDMIDVLVESAKKNGLSSNYTHDKKEDDQLETLQAELAEMRSQLNKLEGENNFQESRWKRTDRENAGLAKEIREVKENQVKVTELLEEAAKLKKNKKGGYWEKVEEAIKLAKI